MTASIPVITVDGPSGAGKGTLCQRIAQHLQWHLLDSGALYRLTALAAQRHGVELDQVDALATLARGLCVRFDWSSAHMETQVILEEQNVTFDIRSEKIGKLASKIASQGAVREALLARQREFRRAPGLVADGRDMGTVVFPDAPVKFFLTASPEERANRRYKQLIEKGMSVSLAHLAEEIVERDRRDAMRPLSPLRTAPDAELLDSTDLDIDEVVARALLIAGRILPRSGDAEI